MTNEDIVCLMGIYTRRSDGYNDGYAPAFTTKGIVGETSISDSVNNRNLLISKQGVGLSEKIDLFDAEHIRIQYTYISPFGNRASQTTNTALIPLEAFFAYPELAISSNLFACCDTSENFQRKECSYVGGRQLLNQEPIRIEKPVTAPMPIDDKLSKLGINEAQLHFLAGLLFINSRQRQTNTPLYIGGLPYNQSLPLISGLLYEMHPEAIINTRGGKFTNFDNDGRTIARVFDDNTLRFAQAENVQVVDPSKLTNYKDMEASLQSTIDNSLAVINIFVSQARTILMEHFTAIKDRADKMRPSIFDGKGKQEKQVLSQEASNGLAHIQGLTQVTDLINELKKIKESDYRAGNVMYAYEEAQLAAQILQKILDDYRQSLTKENTK